MTEEQRKLFRPEQTKPKERERKRNFNTTIMNIMQKALAEEDLPADTAR